MLSTTKLAELLHEKMELEFYKELDYFTDKAPDKLEGAVVYLGTLKQFLDMFHPEGQPFNREVYIILLASNNPLKDMVRQWMFGKEKRVDEEKRCFVSGFADFKLDEDILGIKAI